MSSTFLYGFHVPANGIRHHLLRYGGKGPKLLVVPGITSPAVTWGFVAETLAQHFDVHVLDVRGRGLSSSVIATLKMIVLRMATSAPGR